MNKNLRVKTIEPVSHVLAQRLSVASEIVAQLVIHAALDYIPFSWPSWIPLSQNGIR